MVNPVRGLNQNVGNVVPNLNSHYNQQHQQLMQKMSNYVQGIERINTSNNSFLLALNLDLIIWVYMFFKVLIKTHATHMQHKFMEFTIKEFPKLVI